MKTIEQLIAHNRERSKHLGAAMAVSGRNPDPLDQYLIEIREQYDVSRAVDVTAEIVSVEFK